MVDHKIRQLRKARGMNQETLAQAIGRTKSVISRLEDGSTRLDLEIAKKIADALGVSLAEVLGIGLPQSQQVGDEVEPVRLPGMDGAGALFEDLNPRPFPNRINNQEDLALCYSILVGSLDRVGFMVGDTIAVVPATKRSLKALKPTLGKPKIVLAEAFDGPNGTSRLILRQFAPESSLVANSSQERFPAYDIEKDDVRIIGIVTRVDRILE
jgi:transcriptional regulator with XRE-family HTH domain